MLKLPTIEGIIRRRLLVNFHVDAEVVKRQLPARFRPKLQEGRAVAGICLIRLEHIRPKGLPEMIGMSSENGAHRIAVEWDEDGQTLEGVFIPRRDTNSTFNHLFGGRLFPGVQHAASFEVEESGTEISLSMKARDNSVRVEVEGRVAQNLPSDSIFKSLADASRFFEKGSRGLSVTADPQRLDSIALRTDQWRVEPIDLKRVYSSYFADESRFPAGSAVFDHALLMRNIAHEWLNASDMYL
ncbi:MAG TPA: DUF2071 domain-containing protein [Pyrinomonadaceae bacterium]|jgi:uncharacterized protein YqjF (DUF2071 family)|nr:DUF2071 domain-containing protein [Pyrinomonadaceae bacterium]